MPILNNTNVPFGSRVIALKSNVGATKGNYVAENITVQRPSTVIERRDEIGQPSGQVIIDSFVVGSATFQLATTASLIPAIGDTFVTEFIPGTPESCSLSQVDQPEQQTTDKKVNINFRKLYLSFP